MAKLPKAIIDKQRKAEELRKNVEMAKSPVAVVEKPEAEMPQAPPNSAPHVELNGVEPVVQAPPAPQVEQPSQGSGMLGKQEDDAKYKALQGKYNAEVPRLSAEAKQAKAESEDLRKKLEEAERINEELKNSVPTGPATWADQEDIENYGTDYLEVADKASRANVKHIVDPQVQELRREMELLQKGQQEIYEREAAESEQLLHSKIAAVYPNWVTLDQDAGWINWLNEYDPVYGDNRRYILKNHYEKRNAEAVIAMFNSYFGNKTPDDPSEFSQPELKHGNPVSVEKKTYSRGEVNNILSEIKANRIKGADATKILKDIREAQSEGRIT